MRKPANRYHVPPGRGGVWRAWVATALTGASLAGSCSVPRVKPPLQSLFRIEANAAAAGDGSRVCVWIAARSPFEALDAKDAFTMAVQRAAIGRCHAWQAAAFVGVRLC